MLGLATHEPNFTIIREEFKPNKPKPCALCNQFGHEVKDCEGLPREKKGKVRTLRWTVLHLKSMLSWEKLALSQSMPFNYFKVYR